MVRKIRRPRPATELLRPGYDLPTRDFGPDVKGGSGAPKDEQAAARLFHQAAERGLVRGAVSLVFLYRDGRGVPKNLVEAYKWCLVAKPAWWFKEGDDRAIEKALTPEHRAEAERRAKEFSSRHPLQIAR
ncbi:MAG: tetratricopeptide repeat protein [Myxococcota bacterium]